jgi:hypothetical protein
MLMDAKLISLIRLAEEGDTDAQWELVSAYKDGKGVKQNSGRLKYYLIKLSMKPEHLLPDYYGGLLSSIGDICYNLKEFEEATEWYIKSLHYFLTNFSKPEAEGLIKEYDVEKGLDGAFYWNSK